MTTLPLVLVTGATGKIGGATVLALTQRYAKVVRTRAMVRKDDHRAQALRDLGAEVVIGDLADLGDMRRAMEGVQRAHFVAPITNNSLDHALNFAVAAREQGVEHVVAIGQWLSSSRHPSQLTRRTWLIDQVISWIPGVDHTIINVGFFAANFMSMLGVAAQLGMLPLPLGTGATAFISNEDIGRVVAGVLADPAPWAGRTLRPTGPAVLSADEIARIYGKVLGREVRYADGEERMAIKSFRAGGHPPFEIAQVVHYLREFRRGSFDAGGATDVVQEVTGQPAEDFETVTRRYAAADPMAVRSFPNLLRAIAQFARILVTPALDVDRWLRDNGIPVIDAEDCADDAEWTRTHDVHNAYGVGNGPSTVALHS